MKNKRLEFKMKQKVNEETQKIINTKNTHKKLVNSKLQIEH